MKLNQTFPRTSRSIGRTSSLLLAGASLTALSVGANLVIDAMGTKYVPKRVFEVAYSTETVTENIKMEIIRDGESMDRGGRGGRTQTFELDYTDTVLEAADGAPTKVQRAFDSVGGDMIMDGRDEPIERSLESAFDGITLVLTGGEDGVEVEVSDGDAPDAERLEGHTLRLPLDGLLPTEETEEGAEWEIDGAEFMAAMGLGMQGRLVDRPEREGGGEGRGGRGGGGRRGGRQRGGGDGGSMLKDGSWEVTGTLTGDTREVDGVTCAVIKIDAEVEGEPEGGPEREGMSRESSYTGEFEGELLFSIEGGHPVSLDVTGGYELTSDSSFDSERGSMEMSRIDETKITLSVTVAASMASDDE